MIDLDALKREAESGDDDRTVVSRCWLGQVLAELVAGRQAAAERDADRAAVGLVFGLRPGERI